MKTRCAAQRLIARIVGIGVDAITVVGAGWVGNKVESVDQLTSEIRMIQTHAGIDNGDDNISSTVVRTGRNVPCLGQADVAQMPLQSIQRIVGRRGRATNVIQVHGTHTDLISQKFCSEHCGLHCARLF